MKKIAILALAGLIAAGLPATAQGNKSQKGTPTPKVEQKKPEKKKRKKDFIPQKVKRIKSNYWL